MKRERLTLPAGADALASESQKSTGNATATDLALLQLVYRHDKDPQTLIERVRELKRLLLEPES